jgi:hypothetical protein
MSDDEPFYVERAMLISNRELYGIRQRRGSFPVRFWRHYCMWRMHFTRWNALQAAWRTAR